MSDSLKVPASADPTVYQPALTWWGEAVDRLGRLPKRADLDPLDLGVKALPHIVMVEIIGNVDDLKFRLLGSNHAEFNMAPLSGKLFSEVYPTGSPVLAYLKTLYRDLVQARRPVWSLNEFMPPTREFPIRMGRLMLPLASNGEQVDLCVAVQKIDFVKNKLLQNPWHQSTYTGELERRVL